MVAHVTLPDEDSYVVFTATGGQTAFAFDFVAWEKGDLIVKVNGLTLDASAWSVTFNSGTAGGNDGGTITLNSGATAGQRVEIIRITPTERTSDFAPGSLSFEAINTEFDKAVARDQDARRDVNRAILAPVDEVGIEIQGAAARANKVQGYDGSGQSKLFAADDIEAVSGAISQVIAVAANLDDVGVVATDLGLGASSITTAAAALVNAGSPGIPVVLGPGSVAVRALTAGTGVTVTNGNGAGGNPVIAIGQSVATSADVTFASATLTGALAAAGATLSDDLDMQGNRIILDADNDSYIEVTADDNVRIVIGGTEIQRWDGDTDVSTLNGIDLSLSGAAVGQALGFPNSPTTLEPYTPAGGGDTRKAANETITGDWNFTGALQLGGADVYAVGGADVAVSDGGTGASTASAARSNLGLGASDSVTFSAVTASSINASGDLVVGAGGAERITVDSLTGTTFVGRNLTDQFATGFYVVETNHPVSRRAGLFLGASWMLLQDLYGNGTADFGVFHAATGNTVLNIDVQERMNFGQLAAVSPNMPAGSMTIAGVMHSSAAPVNAKAFGATGDGTTDDSPALKAAADFAQNSRRPLYAPAGRYRMASRVDLLDLPFALVGDGMEFTRFEVDNADGGFRFRSNVEASMAAGEGAVYPCWVSGFSMVAARAAGPSGTGFHAEWYSNRVADPIPRLDPPRPRLVAKHVNFRSPTGDSSTQRFLKCLHGIGVSSSIIEDCWSLAINSGDTDAFHLDCPNDAAAYATIVRDCNAQGGRRGLLCSGWFENFQLHGGEWVGAEIPIDIDGTASQIPSNVKGVGVNYNPVVKIARVHANGKQWCIRARNVIGVDIDAVDLYHGVTPSTDVNGGCLQISNAEGVTIRGQFKSARGPNVTDEALVHLHNVNHFATAGSTFAETKQHQLRVTGACTGGALTGMSFNSNGAAFEACIAMQDATGGAPQDANIIVAGNQFYRSHGTGQVGYAVLMTDMDGVTIGENAVDPAMISGVPYFHTGSSKGVATCRQRFDTSHVQALAGGAAEESFTYQLPAGTFAAKPDVCLIEPVTSAPNNLVFRYDWDAASTDADTLTIKAFMRDGSNIPAGSYRMSIFASTDQL